MVLTYHMFDLLVLVTLQFNQDTSCIGFLTNILIDVYYTILHHEEHLENCHTHHIKLHQSQSFYQEIRPLRIIQFLYSDLLFFVYSSYYSFVAFLFSHRLSPQLYPLSIVFAIFRRIFVAQQTYHESCFSYYFPFAVFLSTN